MRFDLTKNEIVVRRISQNCGGFLSYPFIGPNSPCWKPSVRVPEKFQGISLGFHQHEGAVSPPILDGGSGATFPNRMLFAS